MSPMHVQTAPAGPRRATNVTLPADLVAEAKRLNINVSQACEAGPLTSVAEIRRARWLEENREAIQAYNDRIETSGPTLAAYRRF